MRNFKQAGTLRRYVFLLLSCLSVPARAELRCAWSITGDRTYPLMVSFDEPVTGFRRSDIVVSGGIIEETIPVDGNTAAAKGFKVRLAEREGGPYTVTLSLPAGSVEGSSGQPNEACGPIVFPDPASPTPTALASPTRTPTVTPSYTATVTASPTATAVATASPTPTLTASVTPTLTPYATAPATATATATRAPSSTVAATGTATPVPAPAACSQAMENVPSVVAFPGAVGHGRFAVGGSGRNLLVPCTRVYKVTTLADAGPGSLRECIDGSGPRTCVFEVGGQLWATKELRIRNPFVTIAGQTAPSPGVNIRGSGLSIETGEVIVQHLRFRVGDDPRASCCWNGSCASPVADTCTADPGSRDGVRIYSSATRISNVIIDHVSISWALDEGFSISPYIAEIENITFANSIVGSGLDMSIHPDAESENGHSKGVLISGSKPLSGLSFIGNYLAHNADRNIRATIPLAMEFVNNVVYDWGRGRGIERTMELANSVRATHFVDLIGNLYRPGLDTFCPETEYRRNLCSWNGNDGVDSEAERAKMHYILRVGGGLSRRSRYFLADNLGPTRSAATADEWEAADRSFFEDSSLIYPSNRATAPVASSSSYSPRAAEALTGHIMEHVGARPRDRDVVDDQLLADLVSGEGRIVNCVSDDSSERCRKNAGGWPEYPETRRELTLPDDYTSDPDGNGYTALEELLWAASDALGG